MRAIGDRASRYHQESSKLYPPSGTIGVGCAWFDPLLKASMLDEMLRYLRKGHTPQEAFDQAEIHGIYLVMMHNRNPPGVAINGKWELERWNRSGQDILLWALHQLGDST